MTTHLLEVTDIHGSLKPRSFIQHLKEDKVEGCVRWRAGYHMTSKLADATRFTESEAQALHNLQVGDLAVKVITRQQAEGVTA
jgi:hypothetical protein